MFLGFLGCYLSTLLSKEMIFLGLLQFKQLPKRILEKFRLGQDLNTCLLNGSWALPFGKPNTKSDLVSLCTSKLCYILFANKKTFTRDYFFSVQWQTLTIVI